MQSDDDLQTTLSKWPFILGDVLLVATALAIAILGQWQLTNWQVAACVISVALGAALFVLPYVVEYQVRVREAAEDRSADLRVLQRHLVSSQDQLEAVSDRIEALEGGLTNLAQAKPDLSGPLEAIEQKIEPLLDAKKAQVEQLAAFSKQADALAQQVETLETSLKSKSDSAESESQNKAIEALRSDLDALQVKVAELPEQIREAAETPGDVTSVADEPQSKKTREPRQRRSSEPRLLKRAIDQKRDHASAAVSRIIETKNKKPSDQKSETADEAPADKPESEAKTTEDILPEKAPKEHFKGAEPETVESTEPEATTGVSAKATDPGQVAESSESEAVSEEVKEKLSPEDEAPAEEPEPKQAEAEPEVEPQPENEPKSEPDEPESPSASAPAPKSESAEESQVEESQSETTVGETEDMFADAVPPQVSKRTRTKKSDTAVIASVFIGIGNKPYLRGNGAGLNWETGVAMEFEEIGKWRWLAPADLDAPVELQVYRNDEDPDTTGKYTLEPGQQLELSPVF